MFFALCIGYDDADMSERSVYGQALPAGTRLQEFELCRYLGSGGFGIVYLGWNTEPDISVAIKECLGR